MIGHAFVTVVTLAGLASIAWAKRYELPAHEDVLMQINTPIYEQLNTDHISVMVWNMQKGIQDSWKSDYRQLSAGKDILFLQEVLLDENMGRVLDGQDNYAYQMAASFKDTWEDRVITGVATASAVKPIASSYLRSFHREPVIATPKMAMFAEYTLKDTDRTLLTANIHAINFVSRGKHEHMLAELESVLAEHDGPMILAGDFNTWTEEKTRTLREMIKRLGMNEVSFSNDHRTRVFGNALDWVFARGLTVKEAKVHGAVNGSDHKPMEVAFSIND